MSAPPPRRSLPVMRPRFTLAIVYVMGFFALYCFALVTPQLLHVLRTVPTGPEQQEVAARLVQEAIQPKLLVALAMSVTTVAFGMVKGWLPGARPG